MAHPMTRFESSENVRVIEDLSLTVFYHEEHEGLEGKEQIFMSFMYFMVNSF